MTAPVRWEGFLASADRAVLEAALGQWPGAVGRVITEPFAGIVLRCPDPAAAPEGERARVARFAGAVRAGLPLWSGAFPDVTFLYLSLDVAGDRSTGDGFLCQGGAVLREECGEHALRRLTRVFGVELRSAAELPSVE